MVLSKTSEYALRAISCFASASGVPLRTSDISRQTSVPRAYLSKLLRKLTEAGILQSQAGHGGGFLLAHDPEQITFLEVLEAVGMRLEADRCYLGLGKCNLTEPCSLHQSASMLDQHVLDWARTTRVSDLAASQTPCHPEH